MLQRMLPCVAVVVLDDTQEFSRDLWSCLGTSLQSLHLHLHLHPHQDTQNPRAELESSDWNLQRHSDGISAGVAAGNPKTSAGLVLMKTSSPEMKVVKMTNAGNQRRPRGWLAGWLTGYKTHQKTSQPCGLPLCVSVQSLSTIKQK